MQLLTGKTVHRWWSELSVAPSGQKTKQSEVAGECTSETHCNKDVRYSGAEPWRHRYVSPASRNLRRSATRNQCRLWSSGVMWSLRRAAKLDALLHSGRTEACLPGCSGCSQCCYWRLLHRFKKLFPLSLSPCRLQWWTWVPEFQLVIRWLAVITHPCVVTRDPLAYEEFVSVSRDSTSTPIAVVCRNNSYNRNNNMHIVRYVPAYIYAHSIQNIIIIRT